MKVSSIIPNDAQDHFWAVVEQCICEFHPTKSASALTNLSRLKSGLQDKPLEEFELFFHSEPFDVACALAGQRLEVENYLKRYLEIRDVENALGP